MRRTIGVVLCGAVLLSCGSRAGAGGGTEARGATAAGETETTAGGGTATAAVDGGAAAGEEAATAATNVDAGPALAAESRPCRPIPAPPATATTTVNWDQDDSAECAAGRGAARVALPDEAPRDVELCAAVLEIRPAANPAGFGLEPFATVVLAGDGPEAQRSFLVATPGDTPLPFAAGAVLSVRIHVETIRIHEVVHATIADADGRVLLALSGDGVPEWAPGWQVRQLEVASTQPATERGGAERREHVVGLSTEGRVARVPPGKCRVLTAGDGGWLVEASAISHGEGTRLPDSSDYLQYSLLRVAAP